MIRLSYLGIPFEDHEIPGLCLVASNENEALGIAELTRAHFELRGLRPAISVAFATRDDDSVDFSLEFDSRIGRVDVSGIDPDIPVRLKTGFDLFGQYIILLGHYDNTDIELIPTRIFNIVKTEVKIDTKKLVGTR